MKPFQVEIETKKIIEFTRNYFKKYNLGGAVLGISGGKDSAVVAALLVEALGKENVVGLTLPCHSKDEDKTDAKRIADHYGFELLDFDLTNAYEVFKDNINRLHKNLTEEQIKNSDINLKPRLRMSAVYYFAPLLSALRGKNYIVAGTSNKAELFVGYFTKGGDSVHDISLLADLTVDEVIEIGAYLNVPEKVLYKAPDDGLGNMSDEEKLGVTYADIKKYINNEKLDQEAKEKIERLHRNAAHKFVIPTYKREY